MGISIASSVSAAAGIKKRRMTKSRYLVAVQRLVDADSGEKFHPKLMSFAPFVAPSFTRSPSVHHLYECGRGLDVKDLAAAAFDPGQDASLVLINVQRQEIFSEGVYTPIDLDAAFGPEPQIVVGAGEAPSELEVGGLVFVREDRHRTNLTDALGADDPAGRSRVSEVFYHDGDVP